MKRFQSVTFLYFFVVVILLVSSSCHSRRVSDIRPNMTKEEVASAWGRTDLISYKTTSGITFETWEYHFRGSRSICQITFVEDRVTTNPQCHRPPVEERYYAWYPYPDPYYYPSPYPYYYYPYPYYFGGYYPYYRYHHDHHHGGGRGGGHHGGRDGGGYRGGGKGGGR